MTVSVVIPVYNELGTIEELLERIRAVPLEKEIIIVDDASTDGTRERLREIGRGDTTKVFYLDSNRGKGAALRRGFQSVSGDVVIVQDADLEYSPEDYPALIQPILAGEADIVYGSRFLVPRGNGFKFGYYVGNRFLTGMCNLVSDLRLTDAMTCYKAFRRGVLNGLVLRSDGFAFDSEFTIKVAKKGYRITEVPISYAPRKRVEGKKITWWDGVRHLLTILRFGLLE